MAGWLGVIQLAAHQVVITISQLFFLMMQGLSFAVSILVSNAFGRKDLGSVREYARKGYFMTLGISATLSVLLYCFRYQAAGIFSDSPEVTALAVSLFFLLFAYQFGDGLQLCFANVLRGIQDVKPIMYAALSATTSSPSLPPTFLASRQVSASTEYGWAFLSASPSLESSSTPATAPTCGDSAGCDICDDSPSRVVI